MMTHSARRLLTEENLREMQHRWLGWNVTLLLWIAVRRVELSLDGELEVERLYFRLLSRHAQ